MTVATYFHESKYHDIQVNYFVQIRNIIDKVSILSYIILLDILQPWYASQKVTTNGYIKTYGFKCLQQVCGCVCVLSHEIYIHIYEKSFSTASGEAFSPLSFKFIWFDIKYDQYNHLISSFPQVDHLCRNSKLLKCVSHSSIRANT